MNPMRNGFVLAFCFFSCLQAADPLAIPNNRTIQLNKIQILEQELTSLSKKIEIQKAQIKLLKESIEGNFDTDARLMIKNQNDLGGSYVLTEARYYFDNEEIAVFANEDSKKSVVFDNFSKEGDHELRVEKKYSRHNKIFTYMNDQKYVLVGKREISLKPGNTTYVDVTSYETNQTKDPLKLKYDVKIVPHDL